MSVADTTTLYEPGYLIAGKYELETVLGEGGMGTVWRARNVALESSVAIKVLRALPDRELLRGRLLQEARAAARLTHPAIVKMFDVGETENGDPFIVMELLEGDNLGKLLESEGRLPAVQAVRLLLPIVDALWLAHDKGIVHRDLKPDNVFIVRHEGAIQPTLVDFGIVKVQRVDATHLTKSGDIVGSPDYMSPEQARGLEDVSHLTDVWSLCVVLYEAISGSAPFEGANYNALLREIVEVTPPSLHELGVSDQALSALIARGMSKQPAERFESMGELGRELATWLTAQGVREDICGTTLEARWLRHTGLQRVGRATRPSISDAWPVESASGIRRNTAAGPADKPDSVFQPDRKYRMGAIGVCAVLVVSALVWVLARSGSPPASGVSASGSAQRVPQTPPAPPLAPLSIASTSATPVQGDLTGPLPVSSSSGRAQRGGVRRPKPVAPPDRDGSASKAPPAAGDLLSPY